MPTEIIVLAADSLWKEGLIGSPATSANSGESEKKVMGNKEKKDTRTLPNSKNPNLLS